MNCFHCTAAAPTTRLPVLSEPSGVQHFLLLQDPNDPSPSPSPDLALLYERDLPAEIAVSEVVLNNFNTAWYDEDHAGRSAGISRKSDGTTTRVVPRQKSSKGIVGVCSLAAARLEMLARVLTRGGPRRFSRGGLGENRGAARSERGLRHDDQGRSWSTSWPYRSPLLLGGRGPRPKNLGGIKDSSRVGSISCPAPARAFLGDDSPLFFHPTLNGFSNSHSPRDLATFSTEFHWRDLLMRLFAGMANAAPPTGRNRSQQEVAVDHNMRPVHYKERSKGWSTASTPLEPVYARPRDCMLDLIRWSHAVGFGRELFPKILHLVEHKNQEREVVRFCDRSLDGQAHRVEVDEGGSAGPPLLKEHSPHDHGPRGDSAQNPTRGFSVLLCFPRSCNAWGGEPDSTVKKFATEKDLLVRAIIVAAAEVRRVQAWRAWQGCAVGGGTAAADVARGEGGEVEQQGEELHEGEGEPVLCRGDRSDPVVEDEWSSSRGIFYTVPLVDRIQSDEIQIVSQTVARRQSGLCMVNGTTLLPMVDEDVVVRADAGVVSASVGSSVSSASRQQESQGWLVATNRTAGWLQSGEQPTKDHGWLLPGLQPFCRRADGGHWPCWRGDGPPERTYTAERTPGPVPPVLGASVGAARYDNPPPRLADVMTIDQVLERLPPHDVQEEMTGEKGSLL